MDAGHWFNIKMSSYQNRKSHCGDKTVIRLSYLHCGISYTGKMASLLYPRPTKLEGGYTGFTLSVRPSICPSVRPSVCRRHGFRSISQVCCGISISNLTWWSKAGAYWFPATSLSKWPPGSHIGFFGFQTLTLLWFWISTPNFSGKILMYMGKSLLIFSYVIFKMAACRPYLIFPWTR